MEAPLVLCRVRMPAARWGGEIDKANQIQTDRFPSSEVNGCTLTVPDPFHDARW